MNATDSNGKTPLDYILARRRYSFLNRPEYIFVDTVTKILLDAGVLTKLQLN